MGESRAADENSKLDTWCSSSKLEVVILDNLHEGKSCWLHVQSFNECKHLNFRQCLSQLYGT